ncbi:MAG: SRPBCC family protein [Gemmatimonadota bacterium]
MMNTGGALKVTRPSDREIAMAREFAAPCELVWEAYTRPELLKQWLGVHNGWQLAVCQIDLRPGGAYRYVWRGPDTMKMGMGGVFKEIQPNRRIVATEQFDQAWYPGGQAIQTLTLLERGGLTTLTLNVRYATTEARDVALKSPMDQGVGIGFDTLERVLDEIKEAQS